MVAFALVFIFLGAVCSGVWFATMDSKLLRAISNGAALLAIAFFVFATMAALQAAKAQDGTRGNGHAEHHDQYKHLWNPTTGAHCCNAQKPDGEGDCRPGAVWRDLDGSLKARIGGRQVNVPETALLPPEKNPHAPVGLICERRGVFYCVALSGAGG